MKDVPVIEIDMDKTCTKCGKKGAGKSGVCSKCASDVVFKAAKPDKLDLIGKAINKGGEQVFRLLSLYEISIQAAYITSKEDKVSVGLTIELSPSNEKPDTILTKTKINFIESRIKDEMSDQVSNQAELPLGEA